MRIRACAFSGARNVQCIIHIGTQDDDVGYAIALGSDPAYGELISPAGITIDQLAYSGDDQAILLRLRSGDDPGATIEVDHSTLGRYTLRKEVGAGATTRRNAYVIADNYYQYSIAAISDPFALTGTSGEQDFSVDPAGTISYWRPLSLGGGGSGSGGSGRPTPLVTDSTLDGTGIAGSALSVTNPFTAADEAKLDAIPNQDAANANMLYGFDGSGNYEVTGKDWLNSDDVDTRVAILSSRTLFRKRRQHLRQLGMARKPHGTITSTPSRTLLAAAAMPTRMQTQTHGLTQACRSGRSKAKRAARYHCR